MVSLVILFLVLVLVVFPLWAIIRLRSLGRENDAIASQLATLGAEVRDLREKLRLARSARPSEVVDPRTSPNAAPATIPSVPTSPAALPPLPPAVILPSPLVAAPAATASLPRVASAQPSTVSLPTPVPTAPPSLPTPLVARETFAPPPLLTPARSPAPSPTPRAARIDWEQFMGAKLFAWLGGLAALLGVAFFVKYSFDHDLIPPELRVAIGFVFALGLVIGGLKIDRTRFGITAQTLIATGMVSLYAVTFACSSVYHFEFFGPLATFAVMALITATAFLLAVRLDARVIAVLGMLGGFLTPVVLSTGRDNPPGLFGYLALLDVGLFAVALHRRWFFLVSLAAAGTIALQFGWATKYLSAAKAPTAAVVCLAFCGLFLGCYVVSRRLLQRAQTAGAESEPQSLETDAISNSDHVTWSAIAFPFVAFVFALAFLDYPTVAARPGFYFGFVLLADACLLALAWLDDARPRLHLVAGVAVFALYAAWTGTRLTSDLLPWALGFYLLYAVLHTAFPLLLERHRPAAAPTWWSQLFPPLTLLLMLGPLLKLDDISQLLWPAVLLVDLIAIGLAVVTGSILAVGVVLVMTLCATALWLFGAPVSLAADPSFFLLVVAGFAVLFFFAGIFLVRRLGDRLTDAGSMSRIFGDARAQIPAFSALLPFLLLIMMSARLPLVNPSPVFGLALLLVVLTLGLASILAIEWLPACALAGLAGLEYAWSARHFSVEEPATPLAWYLIFYAIFMVYPFALRRRFGGVTGPWAVAALAGVVQFPLVYRLMQRAWPNEVPGLIPAAFAVLPLLGLGLILRGSVANERARLNQLAWLGGVALLFITLIFPIQFERQWLTVAWALEGAALLWLFHRVPHPGLRATGVLLLVATFVRLTFNDDVLRYRGNDGWSLVNAYLYTYGAAIVCLFVGARLLAPPRDRVWRLHAPSLLNTLGAILAFVFVNLEIAAYFTPPARASVAFEFSGNFARDMSYTIAWALFALGLLLVSIWKQTRAGRYAALALLGVALVKLFFHDLARLEALYRVGALFGVAVIAIVASFAYQRFLPATSPDADEKP